MFDLHQVHQVHQGASLLPALHASASRKGDGPLQVPIVNLDPDREADVLLAVSGLRIGRAAGCVITATRMDEHQDFDAPGRVSPVPLDGIEVGADRVQLRLPAKSVAVIEPGAGPAGHPSRTGDAGARHPTGGKCDFPGPWGAREMISRGYGRAMAGHGRKMFLRPQYLDQRGKFLVHHSGGLGQSKPAVHQRGEIGVQAQPLRLGQYAPDRRNGNAQRTFADAEVGRGNHAGLVLKEGAKA